MIQYTGDATYDALLLASFVLIVLVAVGSAFVQAPYGRFGSPRFGPRISPRWGWFLMELPATLSFLFFYLRGPHRGEVVPLVFLVIWLFHYGNRGFVFPLLMRSSSGLRPSFSVTIVVVGWLVTALHGYLNGAYFSTFGYYPVDWLTDPRFVVGIVIYGVSLAANIHSDRIIRRLRSVDEAHAAKPVYRIPYGGLFKFVTCPSYLSELTAWLGFAMCAWSLAGVFIFAVSAANLVPRAIATHRWYRERFDDYPRQRKALVPFVL